MMSTVDMISGEDAPEKTLQLVTTEGKDSVSC